MSSHTPLPAQGSAPAALSICKSEQPAHECCPLWHPHLLASILPSLWANSPARLSASAGQLLKGSSQASPSSHSSDTTGCSGRFSASRFPCSSVFPLATLRGPPGGQSGPLAAWPSHSSHWWLRFPPRADGVLYHSPVAEPFLGHSGTAHTLAGPSGDTPQTCPPAVI